MPGTGAFIPGRKTCSSPGTRIVIESPTTIRLRANIMEWNQIAEVTVLRTAKGCSDSLNRGVVPTCGAAIAAATNR